MAAPTAEEARAIRRAVGASSYDSWYATLAVPAEELQEEFEQAGENVLLTAAQICRYLADPTLEVSIKLDGKGSEDSRGQSAAWLAKAARLESEAYGSFGLPGPFMTEVDVLGRAEGTNE